MSPVRATRWLALPGVLLLVSSCDSAGPDESRPAAITLVSGNDQNGTVAAALGAALVVRVTSAGGEPVSGVQVTFAVTSGGGSVGVASALTLQDGTAQTTWTLGTRTIGQQRVSATVTTTGTSTANVQFRATATAGNPASVAVSGGNNQTRAPGGALRDSLAALITDSYGNPVPGATVNWQVTGGGGSISPQSSVTDSDGIARALWTLGPALGANSATASVAGVTGIVAFAAQAVPAPTIAQVSPNPLVPGAVATITGTNFSANASNNTVTFGSSTALIEQASPTQLTVVVPCEPSGPITISITAGGESAETSGTMAVPNAINLAAGQSTFLAAGSVCREITGGGHYILAVVNGVSGTTSAAFRLRGAGPGSDAPLAVIPDPVETSLARPRLQLDETLPGLKHRRAHAALLEKNLELVRRLGPPARAARSESAIAAQTAMQQIDVNDTIQIKVPDIRGNLCTDIKATVRGRVVYAGTRGVVLEDIAAPLAGQMDSLWRALGQEFDTVQWDIITANFGNPLAMDAQTDANGRVFMLFSRTVNDFENVAGFVSSGNFFPPAQCPASNLAEIFYGVVPTVAGTDYGTGSEDNPPNWFRLNRSVVVHEGKHIASFAERLARGATNNEESWLEESTAVIAEELFARTVFGFAQHQNTNFDDSLFCERRPVPASHPQQCWHSPFIMYGYFALVYEYLTSMDTRSPLGPIDTDDATFYGSGWSFVRWVADQYATSEAAFFSALTQTTARGGAKLAQVAGRPFEELLVDWAIAHVLDEWAGSGTVQPEHTMPSWNTRDIYSRMNGELPEIFPAPFPRSPRPLSYGRFDADASLRAGTTALFDLSGVTSGSQLIQLAGPLGAGPPSASLRLKIVRIE